MARIRRIKNFPATSAWRSAAARVVVLFLLVERWGTPNGFLHGGDRLSGGPFAMAEGDFSASSAYLREQEHQQRLQQFSLPISDEPSSEFEISRRLLESADGSNHHDSELEHQLRLQRFRLPTDLDLVPEGEAGVVRERLGRRLQSMITSSAAAVGHEAHLEAELMHQQRVFQSSLKLPSDDSVPSEGSGLGLIEGRSRRRLQSWSNPITWWGNEFNVMAYGAKGDGVTEDTQAFQSAWKAACYKAGAIIQIPAGHIFLVGPIMFMGPCEPNIAFQVDGKILAIGANQIPKEWAAVKNNYWLQFKGLVGLKIRGQGVIDGNGATWWGQSCKKTKNGVSRCKSPTALKIYRSTNVVVSGITLANSPQIHMRVDTCNHVLVTGVTATAPADTVNTDGFYFDNTHQATLEYSSAATGDDCVGIQSGSSDILIQHFKCGPGHGISIGSLGEKGTTACVSNVQVRDVTVENAEGAVRIKSWQGGSGTVSGITFQDITVKNVKNPIVIDQYYCDSGTACRNSSSKAVAITNVKFRNIRGTYSAAGGKAVSVACSDLVPCTGISMINVNLWPTSGAKIRYRQGFMGGSFCWKAYGYVDGYSSTVGLKSCIQPQPSDRFWGRALASCRHTCAQE